MNTTDFVPDYRNVVAAARRERPRRLPLYEHNISQKVITAMTGTDMAALYAGSDGDLVAYFSALASFARDHGYDVIPFEGCVTELVQGGQALMGRAPAIIRDRADLDAYPWAELPGRYVARFGRYFEALARALPPGMKAVGGVGNGIFETIQDFVPLTDLAYLEMDDPETFDLLWQRIGTAFLEIWRIFLERYADAYAVCRFGDDLGYKASLLLKPGTVRTYVIPAYRRIIDLVHGAGKPFLLHSCGCIFEVMDDLIGTAGIDAKHSNEDVIAPFPTWLTRYGGRIALFGGVDMNVLCMEKPDAIRRYVQAVLDAAAPYPGVAIGSGNQIADYVPPEGFEAMVETVRAYRGD